MRDLVLNHASLTPPTSHAAIDWLNEIVKCIAYLGNKRVSSGEAIRVGDPAAGWLDQILCEDGSRVVVDSQLGRDESRRLRRLRERSLEYQVDAELASRLRGCEATGCPQVDLNQDNGTPLLLAAFIRGIAISYPSHPTWENDRLRVKFDELSESGEVHDNSIDLDNLSFRTNAKSIADRHQDHMRRSASTPDEFWQTKDVAYPHLKFGKDVKEQLAKVNRARFPDAMRNLATLNDYAEQWPSTKGPAPPWGNFVRSESETVRNNPDLANQRVFTSSDGGKESYFLHTNFSKGDRIHLRIDRATFLVEIGYIGPHLRTGRFS